MNQRAKNRTREHGPHGWIITEERPFVLCMNGPAKLMRCSCGWFGWIPKEMDRAHEPCSY
jgi:hypothetical protein